MRRTPKRILNEVLHKMSMSRNSSDCRIFFILLSAFLRQTYGNQDQGGTIITQIPSRFIFHGNSSVVLTCLTPSAVSPGLTYIWEIYPNKLLVCDERDNTSRNTCTYKPLLEDADKTVTCNVLSGNKVERGSTQPLYLYPPHTSPNISIDKLSISANVTSANVTNANVTSATLGPGSIGSNTLGPGSVVKCEVRGGSPLVSNIVFTCDSPHHPDMPDVAGPGSVTSYVRVTNLQDEDGNITCTCSATWDPRPDLYQHTTTESFQIKSYTFPSSSDSALTTTEVVVTYSTVATLSAIVIIAIIIVAINRRRRKSHRQEYSGSAQEADPAQEVTSDEVYNTLGSHPACCQPGDNDLYDHCSTVFLTGHK